MPNRLSAARSPYLLQHADNPVDWFPWGDEAFELAKRLDRPVFLSVGYSSCHWCHVMAHESFEDVSVAQLLNASFVCVKVDREELPDVDEAYMTAVQLLSGRGGWPMSVFMMPDRRPFFAGTYWPKDDRGGHAGFLSICRQIATTWDQRRSAVEDSASQIATALTESLTATAPAPEGSLDLALIERAVEGLVGSFDQVHGGFGRAPKFPPHTALELLMRFAMGPSENAELQEAAVSVSLMTLRAMILGGIHDQVGGGFHRYSTDEQWLLPHFEKMLYDNALMLRNLALGAGIAAELEPPLSQMFARAAQGIIDWLMREMTSDDGPFFSAQDADSEGVEGKFYTWTVEEVSRILEHHAPVFMEAFGFQDGGNFTDEAHGNKSGENIPYLREDLRPQFEHELEMLRLEREKRVHPGLDNKALVGWNGLMIAGLAEAGIWPLAQNAVVGVLAAEQKLGRLPHQITRSEPSGTAYLEDYAFFIHGLLKLASCMSIFEEADQMPSQAIPSEALFAEADRLCAEMVAKFYDESGGGFYATSEDHEQLFGRTKPVFDQPIPSANSMAIRCLLDLGDTDRARKSLEGFHGWMQQAPHATESMCVAALTLFSLSDPEQPEAVEVPIEIVEGLPPAAATPRAEIMVRMSGRELIADAKSVGSGAISLSIPKGWHLNSAAPPARWIIATKVSIEGLQAEVSYPAAVDDRYFGDIEIPFTVRLPTGESGAEFEVTVSYQACTESECLAPAETRFSAVVLRA